MGEYSDILLGGGAAAPAPAAAAAPESAPAYSRVLLEGPAPAAPVPRRLQPRQGDASRTNAALDSARAIGDAAASVYRGAHSLVTGDDRREFDYPELPPTMIQGQGELQSLLALGQSEAAKRDIFKRLMPGVPLKTDKFGNDYAVMPGGGGDKPFYLNRPGASAQDLNEALTQGAMLAPAARLANLVRGVPAVVRMGTAGAAGSAAQDVAAGAAGSEQGVELGPLVANTATMAGLQAISPMANGLYRMMRRDAVLVDPATGMPTEAGLRAFGRAGIDPAAVSRAFADEFQRRGAQAADPAAAAIDAQARSLPVPVPLTRGDVTRQASDQMFESLGEKGAYGRGAESLMRTTREDQQAALRGNVDAIQGRLAGGAPAVTEPGAAGAAVQRRLVGQKAADKAGVDAAYDTAREGVAALPNMQVQALRHFVGMGDDVADLLPHAPKAQGQLAALDALGEAKDSSVTVKALYDWRRVTGKLASTSTDPTEATALRGMVKRFDQALPEMVKDGLLQGDQAAIDQWKKAIDLRKALGDKFQGKDLVEDLVATERASGKTRLAVAPEEASNYIFGLQRAGLANKTDLARDLSRMKELLGPDSAEWNALREEAWLRLARAGDGQYGRSVEVREFSGARYARALDDALLRNKQVMTTLFAPDEIATMRQLKDVALRTTTTTRGGDNYSNTAPAAANLVQNLARALWLGDGTKAMVIASVPALRAVYGGAAAVRATAGRGAPRAALPPGAAAVGGTAAMPGGSDQGE